MIKTDEAADEFRTLSPERRRNAKRALVQLGFGPLNRDTKPLEGFDNLWRMRAGNMRVLFRTEPRRVIRVVRIRLRPTAYDDLERLLPDP